MGNPQANLPVGPTAYEQAQERLAREDKATVGDYAGSMYRQDSLIDGTVAAIVGQQLMPDPSFNVHDPKVWEELTNGISPEFQSGFYDAHSPAHASMIRDRILQKQEDLVRLGDMGTLGNVGRFAMGFVMPDQLALMAMSGGVSAAYRGVQVGQAIKRGGTAVGAATEVAGVAVTNASRGASGAAMAAGVASGAVGNAAFEKVRQNLNFEDDNAEVLVAGLMGAAITVPFAYAGARTERRILAAATREHEALKIIKMVDEGTPLSADQSKAFKDIVDSHETIRDLVSGKIDAEDARSRLDSLHFGPELEDQAWLQRYGEDLHARGEQMLDEMFPNRITERTRQQFTPDGQPLQLGYDATAGNGQLNTLRVDSKGNVAPALDPAAVEAELQARAMKRHPKDAAKREAYLVDERTKMLGLEAPTDFKAKVKAARDAEFAKKKASAALQAERRKAIKKEEDSLVAMVEKYAASGDTVKHKAALDAKAAAAKQADDDFEAQVAAHFQASEAADVPEPKPDVAGLSKLIDDYTPENAAKAPEAPSELPPEMADAVGASTPVVASEAPAARGVGDYATFTYKKDPEDVFDGYVESISDDGNFYKIRDREGKLHTIHKDRVVEHQATPAGFLDDSVGANRVTGAAIADPRTQITAMSKARLDFYATLNRSQNEEVRKLTFDLIKDPIQNDDVSAQGMTASEYKSLIKRTVSGMFHRESREAANEAAKLQGIPLWGRISGEWDANFHSLVTRYTRGDLTIQGPHADILPMIKRSSAAQQKVYGHLLEEAKKAGVKGAENVDANAAYVNRIWKHSAINDAIRLHGEDSVIDLLARAINVPGLTGDKAKAKQFLSTVRKLEFSPVMQNIHLYAQDMGSLRKALAADGKLGDSDIDNIVDMMFVAKEADGKDTGRVANLKYRFDIDETMSQNLQGTGVLRIADLFENDSRVLIDIYTNSLGGQIALAKKGMYSQADFMERLRKISDQIVEHPEWDQAAAKRELTLLEDVYANLSGKPMSTQAFDAPARIAATMRGYTRALVLGQLGLTAAFEMVQAVAYMGLKATFRQMPTFRQFFYAIRKGHIPDSRLARDIEHMVGFGTEMDMSYARAHEIDEGGSGFLLTKLEAGANRASHAVDIMSGNASITSMTRQWASMMAVQEMHDFATGLKQLTDAQRTRFVGHGLDFYEVDGVLADLKTYTTATPGHKVETVDWERWLKEEPETYQKFQTALSRKVRDAVQDHDLGETMPFMHTTLGKLFGELKTFMLVGHAKNFLKNLHYRDATTLQLYLFSIVGNALAYMTQSSINFAHDPEKLQEMLTMDRISRAVFARTATLGVTSIIADTAYGIGTGGESLLRQGSTANTDNRSAFITPSMQLAQKLITAPSTLTGMVLPGATTTQQEFKRLPMPNLYGVRNLADSLSGMFPKYEPAPAGQ